MSECSAHIPDHTLRRPIGRGAYGEVWLARNVMGAPRAVKIVWRRQFQSDRPYEREFAGIQRYEPVSRSAEGLVHLLHVGRNDAEGYFYYVMELADPAEPDAAAPLLSGQLDLPDRTPLVDYAPRTLRSDLKQFGHLPVPDCLRVAIEVVGGLAQLHDRGLVHRDVKPGNIIFVDGRAKLADIGLVSTSSEGRTFVGTEGYIPPEGPGSPAADLYALGMVLYEAVTGYPADAFPKVPPSWFAEEAGPEPLEFHEVVLKACEAARERRYRSAAEMQADLALLQSGQSVRHMRALERRINRWRRIGWAAALCVAVAVGASLMANWRARLAAEGRANETQLREQAQRSLVRATSAEREYREQLYTSLLEQARATVRSGELGQRVRALDALRRAAAISNSVELRREVVAALALPDLRLERTLPLGAEFTFKEPNPAFDQIALARGRGPVEIRAVADDRRVALLPASTNLLAYAGHWSGDGRFLAVKRDYDTAGTRADLEVWLVPEARRVLLVRDVRYNAGTFHPTRPQILTGGADGWVVAWDLQEGRELSRRKFDGAPGLMAYSPDGEFVAAGYDVSGIGHVSVHRATDGVMVASHSFDDRIWSLAWHPGGRWLALSDANGGVHGLDARTGRTRLFGQHRAEAVLTVFSPDGEYLMTGGWERELICWDANGGRRAFTIPLDSYVLRFRADSRQCAVLTPAGVELHAFERPTVQRELPLELGARLRFARFSPDGRWLAASDDKRTGVWDLAAGGPAAFAEEGAEARFFFTPDGHELFGSRSTASGRDGLRWGITPARHAGEPPRLERLPLVRPKGFTSLSLISNTVVITTTEGSQVVPPDQLSTGPGRLAQTTWGVNLVSPDGRWLAIHRPFSQNLYLHQLPGLERVAKLTHPVSINDFAFSPASDEIAIASRWGVEFWSTQDWTRTRMQTNCSGIHFVEDRQTAWLIKDLRTAGLYDIRTFDPLLMLPNGMIPLAVSPDGRRLALSVDRRRLQVWDLPALRTELANLGLDWEIAMP